MYILGFSGGCSTEYDDTLSWGAREFGHDAAAVLLRDGQIVAAVEEERLSRIKHANHRPTRAVRYCLQEAGIGLDEVHKIACYSAEQVLDLKLAELYFRRPSIKQRLTARQLTKQWLQRDFDFVVDDAVLEFVSHHHAHAASAFAMSEFDEALVMTFDGSDGNDHFGSAGAVDVARGRSLERIHAWPMSASLGFFYMRSIALLGYRCFDEYKVMGLAPYGDPARFADLLGTQYTLLDDGQFRIHVSLEALQQKVAPCRKGDELTQEHKDFAAALQVALERLALHAVRHFQATTGMRRLCLAGGVAHNCTMNGQILESGLFEDMFVQPAAHDAGCALGAAIQTHWKEQDTPVQIQRPIFWGPVAAKADDIPSRLAAWGGVVEVESLSSVASTVAKLIADGEVVGWVQGRTEFGPRALGNRSILADPRPVENKDRINKMVKKREGYRPFAPSVLEEDVRDFFVIPPGRDAYPFMIFVVKVREEMRERLGAITHVNGTARVQTVSRDTEPKYWEVINAFKDLTGIPMLLNTSFNNDVEPIVNTLDDAVTCFLTTELDALIVGDYLVRRVDPDKARDGYLGLAPGLPMYARLITTRRFRPHEGFSPVHQIAGHELSPGPFDVSAGCHAILERADGERTLAALGEELELQDELDPIVDEVLELWSRRMVNLTPPGG